MTRHIDFKVRSQRFVFWAALFSSSAAFADTSSEARLAYGREVDRTTILTESCVPTSEHLENGELHAVTFAGHREPETVLTVKIEENRGAVHLLFYTHQDILWRLLVEEGSSVETVYTLGPRHTAVLGLPEETLAYSLAYDETGTPVQNCRPYKDTEADLANAAFYYSWTPGRHRVLESAFEAHAGQAISSLVLIDSDETVGAVSATSIKKTRQIRNDGKAVLRNTRLPGDFDASNKAITVPRGLTSTELHDWLIEAGAAEPAGEEVLDFLCLREKVAYWAVGMDTSGFGSWCEARERWEASRRLVLRASINLETDYQCKGDRHIVIYVPSQISVEGRFVNCPISVSEIGVQR